MFQLTTVARNLLIANVVLLILDSLLGGVLSKWFALYYVGSENFAPYQFITYMFFHGGLGHLFGNMLALFFFGPWLERTWGPQRFFIFYMATGIGAGLLYGLVQTIEMQMLLSDISAYSANPNPDLFAAFIHDKAGYLYSDLYDFINAYAENPNDLAYIDQSKSYLQQLYNRISNVPMVGASGAVFGILLGFGMLFPNTQIFLLFPPIPIKAKYLVTFYGLYEAYALFQNAPGDNVAHLAHLGGMLFAYFFIRKWRNSGNNF
jgi:membrane associated rhomboid family serine protease